MEDFHFIPVEDKKRLEKLILFLRPQGLDYPNWETWINKTYFEIIQGYKKAILCESNGITLGNIIFQPHKDLRGFYEIKNARISKEFFNFGLGSFLFSQAERIAKKDSFGVMCDLRENEQGVFNFLLRRGYSPIGKINLYDTHNLDIVMVKSLDKNSQNKLFYSAREKFFNSQIL